MGAKWDKKSEIYRVQFMINTVNYQFSSYTLNKELAELRYSNTREYVKNGGDPDFVRGTWPEPTRLPQKEGFCFCPMCRDEKGQGYQNQKMFVYFNKSDQYSLLCNYHRQRIINDYVNRNIVSPYLFECVVRKYTIHNNPGIKTEPRPKRCGIMLDGWVVEHAYSLFISDYNQALNRANQILKALLKGQDPDFVRGTWPESINLPIKENYKFCHRCRDEKGQGYQPISSFGIHRGKRLKGYMGVCDTHQKEQQSKRNKYYNRGYEKNGCNFSKGIICDGQKNVAIGPSLTSSGGYTIRIWCYKCKLNRQISLFTKNRDLAEQRKEQIVEALRKQEDPDFIRGSWEGAQRLPDKDSYYFCKRCQKELGQGYQPKNKFKLSKHHGMCIKHRKQSEIESLKKKKKENKQDKQFCDITKIQIALENAGFETNSDSIGKEYQNGQY